MLEESTDIFLYCYQLFSIQFLNFCLQAGNLDSNKHFVLLNKNNLIIYM
jgi:hypothetical protein